MSAHAISAAIAVLPGAQKRVIATLTGSADYDTGGSVLDLSVAGTLGAVNGFATVKGLDIIAGTAAADGAYALRYVPGANASNGLVYSTLTEQALPAQSALHDNLSARSWTVEIVGI